MIFLLLIFMFFLGVTQVVWAIIQAIVTQQKLVRKHFGIYGLGVILYFLIWWVMFEARPGDEFSVPFIIHFFTGATALCIYHIWIVALSFRMRRDEIAAMHQAEWV